MEMNETRAERFYDRIRKNIHGYLQNKGSAIEKSGDYLLLVPDIFILLFRLAKDPRVTGKNKVLLGSSLVYYVIPLDFIPEALLGPMGYLDDLVFGVYVLNKILIDTDPAIVREHWSGKGDVLDSIQRVLNAADSLVGSDVLSRFKNMMK